MSSSADNGDSQALAATTPARADVPSYDWYKFLLFITDRCNLVCKMCPIIVVDPKARMRQTLPRELAFQAADFAIRKGFKEIEVAGGEATVVDYFWELLDKLCSGDAEVRLVTNGLLTKDEHIQTFLRYPNLQVQVSIDGTEKIHDEIRGAKRSFARAADTLERLVAAGCKRVSINTVVQRSNYMDMLNVYERFKHLPYLYHAFSIVEEKEAPDETIPSDKLDEAFGILRRIQSRALKDGKDVILSNDLLDAYYFRMRYPHYRMHPGMGCTVVQRQVVVMNDGKVVPCYHKLWDESDHRRNLHHRTMDEILEDPEILKEMQEAIGPEGCLGCSTMCYNWDSEFRRKVMHPDGIAKAQRMLLRSKEYLRENHPKAFRVAKRVKDSLQGAAGLTR